MQQASRCFSDEDRKRVNRTVAAAEARTAAEIVPVVATQSGRYDRAEDIVGLWVGLIALTLAWWVVPEASEESGSWGGVPPILEVAGLIAAMVVGFVLGVAAAGHVFTLRRLFTLRRQMQDEVQARARQAFFDSSVHHTAGGTGVLLYVSLYERMTAVLGDQKVNAALGQTEIEDLCRMLTGSLRSASVTEALCAAIEATGRKLEAALPRAGGDSNELPDALVTID
jgi:putative membrane protein